jgi:5S rRNA maturation endonuclease (ribonuclease M5)
MTAYIVCEGEHDAQLLKRVLPEELVDTVVVAAGGLSEVKSLARSLIVRRQSPVAIVVDADASTRQLIEGLRKNTEEIIGSVAANTPFKVILAVPTLETIFFQDVSLLSRLLGDVPSQDVLSLAVYQPSQILKQLISQSKKYQSQTQLVEQLTNEDLEILRKAPVIQEVIQFLQSVRETADAL